MFDRFGKFFKGEQLKHTSIVGFCHSQGYVVWVWWSLSVIFIKNIVKIEGCHLKQDLLGSLPTHRSQSAVWYSGHPHAASETWLFASIISPLALRSSPFHHCSV